MNSLKIARMMCSCIFGGVVGACDTDLWVKVVLFLLYFGYGILNAIDY